MKDTIAPFLFGFVLGFLASILLATTVFRQAAIHAGVAEYYLDAEYQRQFRFITNGGGK